MNTVNSGIQKKSFYQRKKVDGLYQHIHSYFSMRDQLKTKTSSSFPASNAGGKFIWHSFIYGEASESTKWCKNIHQRLKNCVFKALVWVLRKNKSHSLSTQKTFLVSPTSLHFSSLVLGNRKTKNVKWESFTAPFTANHREVNSQIQAYLLPALLCSCFYIQ